MTWQAGRAQQNDTFRAGTAIWEILKVYKSQMEIKKKIMLYKIHCKKREKSVFGAGEDHVLDLTEPVVC